jgi:hypothetical protein
MVLGMAASRSGSQDSHGGSQDSAGWQVNRCLLPRWNKRPKYKCGCVCIIDTWDICASNMFARRRYFKCPELDPDFMVYGRVVSSDLYFCHFLTLVSLSL